MKKYIQSVGTILFLALFLPYTLTLLLHGREGVHCEEELPELEYQVMYRLIQEDHFWVQDQTLELLAMLYRTELIQARENKDVGKIFKGLKSDHYSRIEKAVRSTEGQIIQIDGEYRELPYHMLSAGKTREGNLLGEEFSYVTVSDCPLDLKSNQYLQIFMLSGQELNRTLGQEFDFDNMELVRDSSDYVIKVKCPKKEWQGETFRTLLHLASSCFWMEETEKGIRVTVKGNGHGFGISLYTADQMAKNGKSIQEILDQFYKKAECITIP
ncbi:MAG: hypothetical protein IKV59_10885 [Lachnospiraceae bacterium]|nr:hypothetical protein [Lachnospiraceae bacterium]